MNRIKFFRIFVVVVFIPMVGCVDPVTPEFQIEEGLVFIEGFASTSPRASFVTISESAIEFGVKVVNFIGGASVSFENVDSGRTVLLTEVRDTYLAPPDFVVVPGETWKLSIVLANGNRYESTPETILAPVPINEISVRYDTELEFREIYGGKFVPGHAVSISFDDPPADTNNYYWSYRSFENLDYCEKCYEGVFRNGECIPADIPGPGLRYFDYICETDCWRIRFPESVSVFNDQFSNGNTVSNLEVGNLLLYTKENMVVEVQQFSLSPAAYDYYKVLKDIVDNSGGLNAPPPAALIGNLSNPENSDEFVLGRFTAASSSVASIYIERESIQEPPLETREPIVLEPLVGSPYPPPATNTAPCSETRFRTANEPNGWID
jgi:hypothetical protein